MKKRSVIRLAVAEISAVAINVIPLGLWFFEDYSSEATMVIYALESVAAIVFAIICVLLISPAYDPDGSARYKKRSKLIADFSTISLGFFAISAVFLVAFMFLVLKASVDARSVIFAFLIVVAFQAAELITNILTLRPLPLKKAELLLSRSMGQTALLFLGIFIGVFLAGFVNEWFVVPFIVMKTIVDVGEPIQFFLGKEEDPPGANVLASGRG